MKIANRLARLADWEAKAIIKGRMQYIRQRAKQLREESDATTSNLAPHIRSVLKAAGPGGVVGKSCKTRQSRCAGCRCEFRAWMFTNVIIGVASNCARVVQKDLSRHWGMQIAIGVQMMRHHWSWLMLLMEYMECCSALLAVD